MLKLELKGGIRETAVSRGGLRVNHLLFVKDCMLFCKILGVYEKASGQTLNKHKTSIFFSSNTTSEVRRKIFRDAGAVVCDSYEKYLGLPIVIGRSKCNALRSIKERIWMKMQN